MQVILLERVEKLGAMGDTVRVKDGYARNFLLPRGKALRASAKNMKKFEGQRVSVGVVEIAGDVVAEELSLDGLLILQRRDQGGHVVDRKNVKTNDERRATSFSAFSTNSRLRPSLSSVAARSRSKTLLRSLSGRAS